MNKLISKIDNLIIKLMQLVETEIEGCGNNIKDKKNLTDIIYKLVPLVLKLEKIRKTHIHKIDADDDIKIIQQFLQENQQMFIAKRGGSLLK